MSGFLLAWAVLAALTAQLGTNRRIGYWKTAIISLLLSPLVGAIAALTSKHLDDIKREEETLQELKRLSSH